MNLTAPDLYKSILFRAADIYDVEYEDVERDIGQQFDPVIRFMAGAVASELERVYQHLNDTESRLQKRLAKVLLPEYFHLPQPAHALAVVAANTDAIVIDERTEFVTDSDEEEKNNFAFSPVFPSRIVPANIKVIATENEVFAVRNRPKRQSRKTTTSISEVKKIVIGFESAEPILNWQGLSLYFNLKGGNIEEGEKALFFAALSKAKCKFHGHKLNSQSGLTSSEMVLEDYLNGNERMQSNIHARYKHHFITFTDTNIPETNPIIPEEFLGAWFSKSEEVAEAMAARIGKISEANQKELYWLEIELAKPVEISQVIARLEIRFNVVPLVNRRLNGHDRGAHHYLRNNSIKWVSLKPEEDFLSIRKVYEEKPPEYQNFIFKPFAEFKEERKPSYTLRHGGVGRWDDFNAWKRLAYVVGILQENFKHNELIEEAASALSLEDVHHLLGKRISKTAQEEKPTRDIYVLLHAGVVTGIRVRVEYWTSQGAAANNIPSKTKLVCVSKHKSALSADALELITTSADGCDPLNSTQQINAMKSALLSRGRIVTREDVKVFCQTFLHEKLEEVQVLDGVGTDPRFDFGMTRLLDVKLRPAKKAKNQDWDGICRQVQTLLEQKSTSSIPIRVQLLNENRMAS